jgi:hypothetical protein
MVKPSVQSNATRKEKERNGSWALWHRPEIPVHERWEDLNFNASLVYTVTVRPA